MGVAEKTDDAEDATGETAVGAATAPAAKPGGTSAEGWAPAAANNEAADVGCWNPRSATAAGFRSCAAGFWTKAAAAAIAVGLLNIDVM